MNKYLFVVALMGLILSCNFIMPPHQLQAYVAAEVKQDKGTIDISRFNKVKWDKLYVIPPYSSEKVFDTLLMKHKRKILHTGIDTDDRMCLIVLFNKSELVDLSEINGMVDFADAKKYTPDFKLGFYNKQDAVFKYKKGQLHQLIIVK